MSIRLKEGSGAKSAGAFLSLSKNHKITPVSDIMKETGCKAGSFTRRTSGCFISLLRLPPEKMT